MLSDLLKTPEKIEFINYTTYAKRIIVKPFWGSCDEMGSIGLWG